jgi:protease-4
METSPAALARLVTARVGGDEPADLLLELDLSRGVAEAPPATPVEAARARHVPVLRHLVEGLYQGARDPRVRGLVAHVGAAAPTLAAAGELRAAVQRFRAAGKRAVCWSESFGEMAPGNVQYYLATGFDQIWLQPSGDVGLTGVVARGLFVHEALERAGVSPQMSQRHEYKTAADMFLRDGMTDAHREMATRLAESSMETVVAAVAEGRRLPADAVWDAVGRAPLHADEARDLGLVDRLGYRDEVYAAVRAALPPVRLRYVERYRKRPRSNPARRMPGRSRPAVAVVHASGPIHLGRSHGGSPLRGRSIGSDTLGAALRAARDDDAVRAVVLRVDSPGGSYVASDALRREVLAVPADVVLADAGTITGSIGVLAGKQVIRDALRRWGVHVESVSVGAQAEMFSTQREFSADEWQRLETWLDRVYDDFTAKAAHDRGMDVQRLRDLAKGRVWTGADAHLHGLVDDLGGLEDAVDAACERAGVRRSDAEVRTLPKAQMLQALRPAQSSESPAAARAASLPSVEGGTLLGAVYRALGMPPFGVLTTPLWWDLR